MVTQENNIIFISGKWAMENRISVVRLLNSFIEKSEDKTIMIDFSRTEFIDSSSISELIMLQRQLRKDNRTLRICNPSDALRKIMKIVQLNRIIPIDE
jgi:anti-anti-sigma factor